MSPLDSVDWSCVSPSCDGVLGKIIRGELVLADDARANTDGTKVVVMCPKCGRTKVWYSKEQAIIGDFFNILVSAVGEFVRSNRR